MQERQTKTEFKGRSPRTQGQLLLVLEFTMALTCVLLMGRTWLRLYLLFAVVSLPGLLLAYYMLSFKNWFRLDDENERIEVPFKQNIPYSNVRAIHITEFDGHISASAQKGKLDRTSLVQNLNPKEKWRLLEELKKRFSEDMLRETRMQQWKMTLGVYIAPILPCLFLLVFTYYMTERFPQVKAMPQKRDLTLEFAPSEATDEQVLDVVSFTLPKGFRVEEEKRRSISFENVDRKTNLRVHV